MALSAGTRLGSYEVVASIGEGGMGQVYRARDTKLNRDVALKVLHDVVVGDPDRLARFRREAQVLASLNHPNVAHLYGFEDAAAVQALVMELVEGPTLADRIAAGAMPLTDVLPIARQIADALESAHEQGIVHRDLKPANVKVRDDGTVKVLDFGLAKALAGDGATGSVENSPTLTARATQLGVILGTAAYMAPEQARGRSVDRRADVWAFGVVLYEMLSGTRAFDGEDISITLAGVLKEDVNWQALPADLPVPVRRLLRRCLEKDPKRRLGSIGDARLELEEATAPADRDGASSIISTPAIKVPEVPLWRRALPWGAALTSLGLAIAFLVMWAPWKAEAPPLPRRLLANIGADASLASNVGASVVLSPDATTVAFTAQAGGEFRLYVRKLAELQAAPLPGTEGAASPFFSPKGDWIGYATGGKLKKVSVTGGASILLCDAPAFRGGTWIDDETIVFSPANTANTTLMRVSASGGATSAFTKLSEGATSQRWPDRLPAGKGVLYTEASSATNWDTANLMVASASGSDPKIVVRGGYYGRYVGSPSAGARQGHLIYMQQGTVFAVPFDLDRLETTGQAVPAIEGVAASTSNTAGVQIALGSDGTLVFLQGSAGTSAGNPIDWMTRDGKTSVLRATPANWANPRFSPDGQKIALEISDGKQRDIWVYEWARDTIRQLTFDAADDVNPIWTPNSQKIVFSSDRAKPGIRNLYWSNADGTGEVSRLTDSPDVQQAYSWTPDQKVLAFQQSRAATGIDLMLLPMEGDAAKGWKPGTPTVLLATPATEVFPTFSPDGRWIAYFANDAGTMDVYVRPFPGSGGPWRISLPGQVATFPRWSRTSPELLFLSQSKVLSAHYSVVGNSFNADKPQVWSPTAFVGLGNANPYDLHPDGKRLALIASREQADVVRDKVVFVFYFSDYLQKIAPQAK